MKICVKKKYWKVNKINYWLKKGKLFDDRHSHKMLLMDTIEHKFQEIQRQLF